MRLARHANQGPKVIERSLREACKVPYEGDPVVISQGEITPTPSRFRACTARCLHRLVQPESK